MSQNIKDFKKKTSDILRIKYGITRGELIFFIYAIVIISNSYL